MPSWPDKLNPGSFVPTTDVYDIQSIYSLDVNSKEFKEFLVRLRQSINTIAIALNTKDTGYYSLTEFINSQIFFPDPTLNSTGRQNPTWRQVYRKVINFGALPNAGTKPIPHGVVFDDKTSFTRLYGAATNPIAHTYIPLPHSSPTLNENIKLNADGNNVYVTTTIDYRPYTITYIIMEYLKN